jgi:ureidoacrylate peracid hydrolase
MPREMLETLAKKLNPRWSAVLVIDMQNDFVSPGGAFHRTGEDLAMAEATLPRLVRLIGHAREQGVPIVYVRSEYTTDDNRYLSDVFLHQMKKKATGRYFEVPVCMPGSWGGELAPGLEIHPQDTVVVKHRYSAFVNTDLELRLRSQGIRTLLITGISTPMCVESTTRHAHFLDYYNVIVADCVCHYYREEHEQALRRMDTHFGEVAPSERIVEHWAARAATLGQAR